MSIPTIHIDESVDVKNRKGEWARSWHVTFPDRKEQHHTRAGKLWAAILQRCRPDGIAELSRPGYVGTVNAFANFQEFAEWCQLCPGYLGVDENGRRFHLDKDILGLGRKVYSKETCCFVPPALNALFTFSSATRGQYPLGVSWSQRDGKFKAQISYQGKKVGLGYFNTPEAAHAAWQKAKAMAIAQAAKALPEVLKHLREPLLAHAERIDAERRARMETIR